MTLIDGDHQPVQIVKQSLLPRLNAGEKVDVIIAGPTRYGLSVSIGREMFQLNAPSKFAGARTLTLQGIGSSSLSGGQVRIIAEDGRPLPKTILAGLTVRPPSEPQVASSIVENRQFEVAAEPINSKGRAIGPSTTIRLQISHADVESTNAVDKALPAEGLVIKKPPGILRQVAGKVNQEAKLPGLASSQPAAEIVSRSVSTDGGHTATSAHERLPIKIEPGVNAPVATVKSATNPSAVAQHTVSEAKTQVALFPQNRSVESSAPLNGGETEASRNSIASAGSPHRTGTWGGSVAPSNTTSSTAPTPDLNAESGFKLSSRAVVIEHAPNGRVILEAEGQLFRVEQPIDLPLGITLQATFPDSLLLEVASPHASAPESRTTLLTRLVLLLSDIDRAGRYEAEAGPVPARQLPTPDRRLASQFLNLLGGTDERPWEAAQQGRPSVVTEAQRGQIQMLIRELGGIASESLVEGWKSLSLPLGSEVAHAVTFYFREQLLNPDDQGAGQEAERVEVQRAVFDVSFSRLGRCQIDALCQGRRFDLLVRSETVLAPHDRTEISVLFGSACTIAGVNGDIEFKVGDFLEPARSSVVARDLKT